MGFLSTVNVNKLEAKKDVKGLIKALTNKDSDIRSKVADALGEIGGRSGKTLI